MLILIFCVKTQKSNKSLSQLKFNLVIMLKIVYEIKYASVLCVLSIYRAERERERASGVHFPILILKRRLILFICIRMSFEIIDVQNHSDGPKQSR